MVCAPCPKLKGGELCRAGPQSNQYDDEHAPGTGDWGGSCTCPDGQTYQVGDLWGTRANSTAKGECNALACHGGVAGECHKQQVRVRVRVRRRGRVPQAAGQG